MEYLMTYGWALLVIVIVIAILLIMNPFSAPQSCKFDSVGFGCSNMVVVSKAGSSSFLLGGITNGNNNAVKIYHVECVKSSAAKPAYSLTASSNYTEVSNQGVYSFNATTTSPDYVACADAPTIAGADFSGRIWVFYKNSEDGTDYPLRSVSANLVTKTL